MSTLKKYIFIMATYLILIVAVFSVSQYSGELTVKIKKLQDDIQEEKSTISVLNAEWTYLNNPQHIEDLATHYLKLKPTSAKQVISIEDLMAKIKVLDDKEKKHELYLANIKKKRALYLARIHKKRALYLARKKRALYLARKRKLSHKKSTSYHKKTIRKKIIHKK